MSDQQKVPVVRGAQKAMQQFRYEVARELGLALDHDQKAPKRLPVNALAGDLSKRMIALCEQHRRQNDGP